MKESTVLAEIFAVEQQLDVVEWVRRHVAFVPYSPRAFSLDDPPMFAEILQEIVNPLNRRVVISACVQSGKTLAPELALAYLVANIPAPALWLNQTDAEAKDQSEGRLRALFDSILPLRALYNADKNKMRKDTMIFNNGMTLWTLGQNNMRNLQRRSICYVFGDETWQWERGRMEEVAARTTAFANGKCVFMSQGGVAGDDSESAWLSTDQREWTWICPECGGEWQPALEDFDTATAAMTCPYCKHVYDAKPFNREKLNKNAFFKPSAEKTASGRVGFHWNAFSTMSWREIAALYNDATAASERGDDEKLKQFVQKRLALAWNDERLLANQSVRSASAVSAAKVGYHLRDAWDDECVRAAAGKSVRMRFLTVDVQLDHFYWVVRMWSADGRSRLLDCGIAQSFDDIRGIAAQYEVFPRFVGMDCGFRTDEVFAFCAATGATALRGDRKNGWDFKTPAGRVEKAYSPKEIIQTAPRHYCGRHFFSDLRCKDILANLRATGTDRWSYPVNAPKNYEKMLYSERKNEKGVWEQIGHRPNHFFDCEAMQICFALMVGLV